MSTVRELFEVATSKSEKGVRRNAFQKLRYLSQFGDGQEQLAAKLALDHTCLYQEHKGNVAVILKAIEAQKEPNGQNSAVEEDHSGIAGAGADSEASR